MQKIKLKVFEFLNCIKSFVTVVMPEGLQIFNAKNVASNNMQIDPAHYKIATARLYFK